MNPNNDNKIKIPSSITIQKTLLTSVMQEGFWSRWFTHGIESDYIRQNRMKLATLDGWISTLSNRAADLSNLATINKQEKRTVEAEEYYRLSGLYYNLLQWVFPEPDKSKANWYKLCLMQFDKADNVSETQVTRPVLTLDGKKYSGRVNAPTSPSGVVIIINPIDSTKEELYTYEKDFVNSGLVVVSFDGAGQGETLISNNVKADFQSWSSLIEGVIDFAKQEFPNLPINIFGTSTGATWVLEASKNPLVNKVVAVSPAPKHDVKMPEYFKERMSNMLVDFNTPFLPNLQDLEGVSNVLLFHGEKDVMVENDEIIYIYNKIQEPKRLISYKDEGHCCDNKLQEVRQRSITWFEGEDINGI